MKIYRTETFTKIIGTLETCYTERSSGVILGKSGAGKTTAITGFCMKHKDAVYVEVAHDAYSRKSMLLDIIDGLNSVVINKQIQNLVKQVIELLITKKIKILIIDQANYLPPSCFNILMALKERANIGLILAGTLKLESVLKLGSENLELEQFYSRMDYTNPLGKISKADIENFFKEEEVEKDKDYDAMLTAVMVKANSSGQYRTLMKTISAAKKIFKEGKIERFTPQIILNALDVIF